MMSKKFQQDASWDSALAERHTESDLFGRVKERAALYRLGEMGEL